LDLRVAQERGQQAKYADNEPIFLNHRLQKYWELGDKTKRPLQARAFLTLFKNKLAL
jgi:hypothetical protein